MPSWPLELGSVISPVPLGFIAFSFLGLTCWSEAHPKRRIGETTNPWNRADGVAGGVGSLGFGRQLRKQVLPGGAC